MVLYSGGEGASCGKILAFGILGGLYLGLKGRGQVYLEYCRNTRLATNKSDSLKSIFIKYNYNHVIDHETLSTFGLQKMQHRN